MECNRNQNGRSLLVLPGQRYCQPGLAATKRDYVPALGQVNSAENALQRV